MRVTHHVLWEIAHPACGAGGPVYDVWLVPADEAEMFRFQSHYPSGAVVAAPDDQVAVAAWESGGVRTLPPEIRVPVRRLDRGIVTEAVRRWARDGHAVDDISFPEA